MNTFDLQIHTTASDGRHSPAECVKIARMNEVGTIAITDHDTAAGVAEALAAGEELGVRVIPGIEMSAEEHGMHILGFGIDIARRELLDELKKFEENREKGAKKMVENFKAAGFAVEWEDVLKEATGAVIARPHIARAVFGRPENQERLKVTPTMNDFFDRYLSDSSSIYVPRTHISARGAIALIHDSGGVAVWSHPAIHFQQDPVGFEKFLEELLGWGIDGVEVFNPAHTEDGVAMIERAAKKRELLRTAGSDFHAADSSGTTLGREANSTDKTIGDFPIYDRDISGILHALDRAMAGRSAAIARAQ